MSLLFLEVFVLRPHLRHQLCQPRYTSLSSRRSCVNLMSRRRWNCRKSLTALSFSRLRCHPTKPIGGRADILGRGIWAYALPCGLCSSGTPWVRYRPSNAPSGRAGGFRLRQSEPTSFPTRSNLVRRVRASILKLPRTPRPRTPRFQPRTPPSKLNLGHPFSARH